MLIDVEQWRASIQSSLKFLAVCTGKCKSLEIVNRKMQKRLLLAN